MVQQALADPRIAEWWDRDSVLDRQTVGSLASHLARGSVWVVRDYLDADVPETDVDVESAAEYFAAVGESLTDADHASIRERGAAVAALGVARVAPTSTTRSATFRGACRDWPTTAS